jgi:hypothetical protein
MTATTAPARSHLSLACLAAALLVCAAPACAVLLRALANSSLALWWTATAWLPVLVAGEALRARTGFDARRASARPSARAKAGTP